MVKVSIVIPIYNALDEVKVLLKSLKDNFNFYLGEIILINDCSKEETSSYLENYVRENTEFRLVNNEENLGFVKTCNKGMKIAGGDIVVLLNSDTMIPEGFCERIIKCFNSDKKIGVASPISSYSNRYFIPMRKNISLEDMNKRLRKKHKCVYPQMPTSEGFCFCIRKSVIEGIGYFDEVYGKGYHEESDFSYRASVNGWNNVLIDDLYVYHKRCCSFGKKERSEQLQRNNSVFKSRYSVYRQTIIDDMDLDIAVKIENEMFPLMRWFYYGLSRNSKHYILTVFGIKLKFKNKEFDKC